LHHHHRVTHLVALPLLLLHQLLIAGYLSAVYQLPHMKLTMPSCLQVLPTEVTSHPQRWLTLYLGCHQWHCHSSLCLLFLSVKHNLLCHHLLSTLLPHLPLWLLTPGGFGEAVPAAQALLGCLFLEGLSWVFRAPGCCQWL